MQPGPPPEYSSPPPAQRGVLERLQYLFVALGLLVFLILGWRGRLPVMIVGGDDLTYVSISRSLEAGTYREVYSASAPRHVRYPPGYPAWLLVVRKLGGESHDLIRAFNLAFVAVALLSVYFVVRRVSGIGIAMAALFVLAFNPSLLSTSATLLSEAPYLGLTGAALAVSAIASPSSGRAAYLAILLAMGAFLTRAAGLTVVLAIGLWLWQRRRRPELLVFGAACLIVVGGWFAYTRLVPGVEAGRSYATDLTGGLRTRSPEVSRLRPAFQNAVGYTTDGLPSTLALPTIPGTKIDNLLWFVVLIALVGAGIAKLSRTARAVAWYLVLTGALLLVWPWRQDRLLIPVVPFVFAALLIGADRLTRSLPAGARYASLGTLTLLAGFGAFRGALKQDAAAQTCDRSNPFESAGCYNAESRSMAAASHYLRSTAPVGSIVLTVSGAAVNWLSGLLTEPDFLVGRFPPGEAGRELRERGIRYILITGGRTQERTRLGPRLLVSCHDLRLEAPFPPTAFVLTTEPPRIPSEDACGPLRELATRKPGAGQE